MRLVRGEYTKKKRPIFKYVYLNPPIHSHVCLSRPTASKSYKLHNSCFIYISIYVKH